MLYTGLLVLIPLGSNSHSLLFAIGVRCASRLNADLATTEGEKADATEIRKSQHADYVKLSTDYGESVDLPV